MFLADSKTFSLDMISGLEEYAIMKAHESNRYKVENSVKPKYEIDEYDLPSIEEVYDEIQFIMATQGYKMDNARASLNEVDVFHTTTNGIDAYGVFDGSEFVVLKDSQIDMEKKCRLEALNKQRQIALNNGDISEQEGKHYLIKSISFKTPSGAACFVLGGSRNGWSEWKNKDGKTLDEVYRK